MYAIDFPEPVSDARRYSFHLFRVSLGLNKCLSERAWIGVGLAPVGKISWRHVRIPGIRGGEANSSGSSSIGSNFEDLNSFSTGLSDWDCRLWRDFARRSVRSSWARAAQCLRLSVELWLRLRAGDIAEVDFEESSLEPPLKIGRLRIVTSDFRRSGLLRRSSLGARPACGRTESRVKGKRVGSGGPRTLRRLDLRASAFGATSNLPPLGTFVLKSSTNFVRDGDGPSVYYVKNSWTRSHWTRLTRRCPFRRFVYLVVCRGGMQGGCCIYKTSLRDGEWSTYSRQSIWNDERHSKVGRRAWVLQLSSRFYQIVFTLQKCRFAKHDIGTCVLHRQWSLLMSL